MAAATARVGRLTSLAPPSIPVPPHHHTTTHTSEPGADADLEPVYRHLRRYQEAHLSLFPSASSNTLVGGSHHGTKGGAHTPDVPHQTPRGVDSTLPPHPEGSTVTGPFEYECLTAMLLTVEELHTAQLKVRVVHS